MKDEQKTPIDQEISSLAPRFKYPPTPDVSAKVRAKLGAAHPGLRVVWKPVAIVVLLLLLMLFSVPAVRAKLAEIFQVGVVRIFPNAATPYPTPHRYFAGTLTPGKDPPDSLLNLAGRTTLEDARQKAGFSLQLPAYPPDLGAPDIVYHQAEADMVVLVWLEPLNPEKVYLSLHQLGPDSFVLKKMNPTVVQETMVDGQYALWTSGPYMLEIEGKDYKLLRLLEGHTLIWETGAITYRLESGLPLEEAVRIAESLE